jgi:hypothetical protein
MSQATPVINKAIHFFAKMAISILKKNVPSNRA